MVKKVDEILDKRFDDVVIKSTPTFKSGELSGHSFKMAYL